ncbi:MAG: sn-glycerol-3-phosphate transport system permease protein UgpE [Chloroflexota bacterium]|nr:MAG: sn-glycerol-3-phosphate transport system permease protein UgpE [Chloroflexota bacterium]
MAQPVSSQTYSRPYAEQPRGVLAFLTRLQGGTRFTTTDVFTYLYLIVGTFVMFAPVLWLVLSSFKSERGLVEFPPTLLPYWQQTVEVEGYDQPLELYDVTLEDGTVKRLAQVARVGIMARLIDPANPEAEPVQVNINQRQAVRYVNFSLQNYQEAIQKFPFLTYLSNSVVVTVAATVVTLLINSMAAFGLSKYQFRGRDTIFLIILSTLMVPVSVILIPAFLVINEVGWVNNLMGVIIPGAATPTGVFLLRQYMLTIPDELLESARIDGATEWRIYWQIVLPLAAPALAVLAIFSVMWRWNDFLWPLIVLSRTELFTLQVGLNAFQGDLNVQWHYILPMTVLTLLPITVVFAFLQRYITTGIATTGLK